jgi:type IV pilus assembly protein PilO
MAFEGIEKLPIWQRMAVFVLVALLIAVGWYFLFYTDAVESHASAESALTQAQAKLVEAKNKKENFLEQQAEAEINRKMEVLPMNASTVDNLMQVFQQKARLVGMTVESWTNEPEKKEDFYARLPIAVKASGSWPQVAEFFRQVVELKQIVSVSDLSLTVGKKDEDRGPHPLLSVQFKAATYRFLSDEERRSGAGSDKPQRRKKK